MGVFESYSEYYDALYKDKNYLSEVNFVTSLINRFEPSTKHVLELGCGSGVHASLLAELNYNIVGVDLSIEMLRIAEERRQSLPPQTVDRISFIHGDVRSYRAAKTFDCVLALFHVVSYQVTNAEIAQTFRTVSEHLRQGGIFIFDCWYGPAVTSDPPVVRVKRMSSDEVMITRIAEPNMHRNECIVDVNYSIFINSVSSKLTEEIRETHRMRYLFLNEIRLFSEMAGLQIEHSCEWLTGAAPSEKTWGACFVVRKK